jgi:hypothetical protein
MRSYAASSSARKSSTSSMVGVAPRDAAIVSNGRASRRRRRC